MDKKILILLPIWKREAITKICLANLKELQKTFNIEVLCVVSEQWAKIEAFKMGFKYIEAPNECLGTKMNIGIKEAMGMRFDYLMNLGSDDIITPALFDSYKDMFINNVPCFGPTNLTFIDSQAKEARTYNYGIMIGAGRCIRKDILEATLRKGDLYDKIQIGLDMNSMKKLDCTMTEIDNPYNTIYDIKSAVNLWGYEVFYKGNDLTFEDAVSGLTTEQIDKIIEL